MDPKVSTKLQQMKVKVFPQFISCCILISPYVHFVVILVLSVVLCQLCAVCAVLNEIHVVFVLLMRSRVIYL